MTETDLTMRLRAEYFDGVMAKPKTPKAWQHMSDVVARVDEQMRQMVQELIYGKNLTPLELAMAKFDRAIEKLRRDRIPDLLIIHELHNSRAMEFYSYPQRVILGGNQ